MLERFVAGFLGKYIKDLHQEQFRIELWSGVAVVARAELRPEAFDSLQLPLAIKEGSVGELRLHIPWKRLLWDPIVVAFEDVYICTCPRDESEFDVEASENRALAAKKAKLTAAEITKLSSSVWESLLSSLVAKLIANIQVTVRNIHIQYVDDKEESERNFDFGAKLAGLTIDTSETQSGDAEQKVHKTVEVNQFALYWNSAFVSRQEKKKSAGYCLQKGFCKHEEGLAYVLKPMDASAKITVSQANSRNRAEQGSVQYALTVNAEKLDFNLGDSQLYECFLLLESLKVSQLRERYGRFRPHIGIGKPLNWQGLWWQYCINAVCSDVRKRLRTTSWRYFGWRLETRHRYVALYKVKLESLQEGKPPDNNIVEALEELEKELDMDMIFLFRSLAEEKCQLKADGFLDSHKISSDEQNATRWRGWLSLFSFGMFGSSSTMDAAAEIMKDLHKATNNHRQVNESSNGYSLMTVSLQLGKATARLEKSETKHGLVEVTLEGLCLRKPHGSASAVLAIETILVHDLCTQDSCFRQIVTRKGLKNRVNPSKNKSSYFSGQRDMNEAGISADIELSENLRWKIAITVKPLEIVYSPSVFLGLLDFLKLPELREIDNEENDTSFILTVDVKFPVFIVPECNSKQNSTVLVVSLERFAMRLEVKNQEKKGLSNSTPVNFDVKLTGMQCGISKGDVRSSTSFWSNIVESFDVQTELLQYNDSSGTFWKIQGGSDIVTATLSAESCKLLAAVVNSLVDQLQTSLENSQSQPTRVSGHYTVRKVDLQVFMRGIPGVALKGLSCEFDQLEFTFSSECAQQEWTLSIQSFHVDNMDYPKSDQHEFIIKAESPLCFRCLNTLKDQVPSLQLMLHLQYVKCGIYPKIIGALTAFVAGISDDNFNSFGSGSNSRFFSLTTRLDGVSLTFHSSFGTVATVLLPSSSFLLYSSDASFGEWELDGSIDGLQLTGPEFSTHGIPGIPFGSLETAASSRIQVGIAKHAESILKIIVGLEGVKCILLGDYLAVLIGLITSSDWHSPSARETSADERSQTSVQYAVEVTNSRLVLPAGEGSFLEIVIPEFKFSFVPPDFKMRPEKTQVSPFGENMKFFVITGKCLSLASYSKCYYPLINCLDGDIVISVPVMNEPQLQTSITLEFSLVDFIFAGKEFLDQIDCVEQLSTDLARVGRKSSFASSIWECLEAGKSFNLETSKGKNQKKGGGLLLKCSTDVLRTSVFNLKKDGVWEKVLVGKVNSMSFSSALDGEALTDLNINVASINFYDGGGDTRVAFQNPELDLTAIQDKTLLSVEPGESEISILLRSTSTPSLERNVDVLLPSVTFWMHLCSWSKVLSWIFICFPMAEIDEKKVAPGPDTVAWLEVPCLLVALPGFGGKQAIYFTSGLCIKEVKCLGQSVSFLAQLSEMRAETVDENASRLSCFSGGSVQIKGELQLDLPVTIALLFTVDFIDWLCSYSVLQFLNTFLFEQAPEDEEDGLGLDLAVRVQAEIGDVSLLLTDDRCNYDCPLLELVLGNCFFELSWSMNSLQLNISSLLETSYHNNERAVWEPFVEPWRFSANAIKAGSTTSVEVSSSSCLNVNLTEGLSQAVELAVGMFCWSQEKTLNVGLQKNYAPYWLQNDTGTVLYYSLVWPSVDEESGVHSANDSSSWCSLMPGCSVPLFVDENEGRLQRRKPRWNTPHGASERKMLGLMSHRRIRIQLEGTAAASRPMSIDLVGKRRFEAVFSKLRDGEIELDQSTVFSTHVLLDVSLHYHSKLIRLCSTVSLTNMTSLPMQVRLEIPFAIAPKIMEPVLPNEVVPLPVHLAETGRMRLRPYGSAFLWSEAHSLSKLVSVENKQDSLRPVLCYPARPSDAPFRCCINADEQLVSAFKGSDLLNETSRRWRTCNIVLQAPLLVKNGFPCSLKLAIKSSAAVNVHTSVLKGDSVFVYEMDVVNDLNLTFTVPGYSPSSLKLGGGNAQYVLVFNPENAQDRTLHARVDWILDRTSGRREVCISVQYWLYNCSGLDLAFLDHDGEAYTGSEQLLLHTRNDGTSKATTAVAPPKDQGLRSLITTNPSCSACFWRPEPGKLSSHLPSCKVFKSSETNTAARDLSANLEAEEAKPLLYSPAQSAEAGEHKMRLRIFQPLNSAWSQAFLLSPPGGLSPIIIPQPSTKGAYVLCVSSMHVTGACSEMTRTVTFRPRYVLANASRKDICFKQHGTDIVQHLPAGQNVNVHWTDMSRSLFLSVRYDEKGWDWSGGFTLDRLGDTQVKAHNHLNGKMEMLRVEVVYPDAEGGHSMNERLGTLYIILTNDETGFMPYRIDNFSLVRLRFYQRQCEKRENILQSYCSCDYAWDEPCLPPQLVIEVPGEGSLGAYELDNVKTYPSIALHPSGHKTHRLFWVSVHAEGAKRVLSIIDSAQHTQKDPKHITSRLEEKLAQSAVEKFTLKLASIGVSLVDSSPQELVYASAKEVTLQLSQNEREQDVKMVLSMLQIDNQLRHPTYPVMLSRNLSSRNWSVLLNNVSRGHPEAETKIPTVSLVVSKWRNPAGSVDCFRCIYLSVAPLRLELEERGLTRMFGFLRSFVAAWSDMETDKATAFKVQPLRSEAGFSYLRFVEVSAAGAGAAGQPYRSSPAAAAVELHVPTRKLINAAKQKLKVYVEDFCIDPLELTISFSSDPGLLKEKRGVAAQSIFWATGTLLQRRLIALADVEGAPVSLRELVLAHPMANWNSILGMLQRHYTRQLLHELYKFLGSADVFGNPMSFVRSLGSGMWDFVSAPASTLRQNPVHIVQGLTLGTKSLFRNTVFAFSNSATQMSKAARKGVASLALDLNEHEAHDILRDNSIVNEFLEGLTGLLQSSVVGAEKHGIPGVFPGMAVGMLRAIARPAASMLEVAGKTASSIRNSSRPAQPRVSRMRLPRHLKEGSPLLPYSWNEALGMAVLLEADSGRLIEEVYITCQPLAESGVFFLLTENLLCQVKEDSENEQWIILEKNRVEDILYINRDGDSLDVLHLSVLPQNKEAYPFRNVSLQLGSSEGADELQSKLLELVSRSHVKCVALRGR